MGAIAHWLRRLGKPPETSQSGVDEAALTLRVIMLGGLSVLTAMTLSAPLLMERPGAAMVGYGAMLVVHLIALDQLGRGRTRATAIGLCLSLFVLVTLNAYRHPCCANRLPETNSFIPCNTRWAEARGCAEKKPRPRHA